VTTHEADEALLDLPTSSKLDGESEFRSELFEAGCAAVATCADCLPAVADWAALRQRRSRTYRGRAHAVGREVQR